MSLAYRLERVRVEYASRCALDIPHLEIPAGQITGVVGPNGAGKSTLLRVLALLQRPSAGRVELGGHAADRRTRDLTALRRQATYVSQAPLLFHGTVYTNVAYGLHARGLADRGRVDTALAAVGLHGFAGRAARRLSGGEAQRVALARALALDPSVYLLDEPTANVDRAHVPIIESLLCQLGAAGKTVVLATHNLEQAHRLSHTIVSLSQGRPAPGPLVNLLHGRTVRIGDCTYFESGSLRIEMPDDEPRETVALEADHLIISRAPLESSARNCFPGHVTRVARGERGIVLTVDCGVPLLARITPHSYEQMQLNIGTPVYVTFKASAVHSPGI